MAEREQFAFIYGSK